MSVAALKKIYLVVLPKNKQKLLKLLQQKEVVQIVSQKKMLPEEYNSLFQHNNAADNKAEIAELEKRVTDIKWIIDHLENVQKDKGFIKELVQGKDIIKLEEFESLSDFDYSGILSEAKELEEEKNNLKNLLEQKKILKASLNYTIKLLIPLEQYTDTKKTFTFLAVIREKEPAKTISEIESYLEEESCISIINNAGRDTVISVTGRMEKKKQFLEKAENLHLDILDFLGLSGTADENVERLTTETSSIFEKIEVIKGKQNLLAENLPVLHQVFDFWSTQLERVKEETNLLHSSYTTLISGWIRAKDILFLQVLINKVSIVTDLFYTDPDPDDNPPVEYDNSTNIKPFEFVSDLYSRPKYWEIDPTPFLSAFFILFFGICLTDAGYGIFLAAVTFFALKKLQFQSESSHKLVKILFYSGIGTAVVGFLTGGFFGISFVDFPAPLKFLRNVILIDPLKNQMAFLIFTLVLGIIHVGFGITIKLIYSIKNGNLSDALLDQAPFISILLGIVFLGLSFAFDLPLLSYISYALLIISGLVILIFAGRSSEKLAGRIGQGVFSLYSVTGLLGDILSYARLFALGIATAVIAQVVNFIATLAFNVPILGYVLLPIILIAGHLMNIIINSLGGFIHTTRLQFVEFFGKFYEGGGESFQPFNMKLKYTKINN